MIRSKIAYTIFWLWKAFNTVGGSIIGNMVLFCWGVPVSGFVKCVGLPRIEKSVDGQIRIGRNCCLRSSCSSNIVGCNRPVSLGTIQDGQLLIGNNCGLTSTVIVARKHVEIGNHVLIGANCTITDCDFHPLDHAVRRRGDVEGNARPVYIEDDVWLGMNVIVLKGVRIGAGTVVGAGSVVSRSLPGGVIAAGNPARVCRKIN